MASNRPSFPRARRTSSDLPAHPPVVTAGAPAALARRHGTAFVATVAAAAMVAGGTLHAPLAAAQEAAPEPGMSDVAGDVAPALARFARGVDAANWQHPNDEDVDWKAAAKAGTNFAFLKATDGARPGNDYYADDAKAARAAGLVVGSYHKAHPAQDAKAQAKAFAQTIQKVGGNQLPPVLDIEIDEGKSPEEIVAWTRTFLEETKRLTGRTPIVYTYRWFWIEKTRNSTAFTDYPLWIAEYDRDEPTFPLIGGWKEWTFWQRLGDNGHSAGFSGPVDQDVFAGPKSDLEKWVGPVDGSTGHTDPKPGPAPTKVDPAAHGGTRIGGSSVPTKITIPAIPGVKTPPGIHLPMTIPLPAGLLEGAGAGDLGGLLDQLPAELLKSAQFS